MKVLENIAYGAHKNNYLHLHLPEAKRCPVYIYLHGGGMEAGAPEEERAIGLASTLVKRGIAVVCAQYRLYPDAKYPDFYEDGAAIIAWVKNNIGKYIEMTDLFVGGESAGAHITQMLCFNGEYLAKHGLSNDDISGYFHDAGQPTTHFRVLTERGIDERRVVVDDAAPLYYIDGTKKYPPMKFVVADNDMPNRYEQTMLMLSVLRNYNYDMDKITYQVMENAEHCSYGIITDEKGDYLIGKMIYEFIEHYKKED